MFNYIITNIYNRKALYEKELHTSLEWIEGNATGKRIRSVLFYSFANKTNDLIHKTTAIIESIHNASIIHDDVIDNNNMRRSDSSYYKLFGAKRSILDGDFLLVKSIKKIFEIYKDDYIKRLFLRECEATAYGAIMEQTLNKSNYVNFNQYVRMASLKTGSLFKLSCFLGEFLSRPESSNSFKKAKEAAIFGICFGIIYQIQNDLNSYVHEKFENSEDYVQKNITFPIIVGNLDIKSFKNSSNQKEYELIKNMIDSKEFYKKSLELTKKYTEKIRIWPR
ncbi:MAG: polyprenyl synthetase family protein [Holosporales bacterium]|jgi:geranylgeranyl pyrophosphate synthase|nr:polyprenyl synthetase family protein [Holosporales bacterium]